MSQTALVSMAPMFLRGVWIALVAASICLSSAVEAGGPKTHTVYRGHTLGKIAKRYNVSIEAICHANEISRSDPIKPGQKLVIPERDDKTGERARRAADKRRSTRKADKPHRSSRASKKAEKSGDKKPRVHVVYRGQTLGMIARRYHVSVDALCHANGISKRATIQPKQRLLVPGPGDEDGSEARRLRLAGMLDDDDDKGEKKKGQSWTSYKKPAWRRGYITLKSHGRSWRGYVIGPGNRVLGRAQQKVSDTLASWRTGKRVPIDSRLVRLIAKVSDVFGGRPLHVVSGYREHSHSATSRHPEGRALDFSIEGVPNWAVRDYLRTLGGVGVGYYPNSTFVHVDVRDDSAYWVDYSGPGEPPRYARQ